MSNARNQRNRANNQRKNEGNNLNLYNQPQIDHLLQSTHFHIAPVSIPITTRGIGLLIKNVFREVQCTAYRCSDDYSSDDDISDHEDTFLTETVPATLNIAYRVSLAQLETKINNAPEFRRHHGIEPDVGINMERNFSYLFDLKENLHNISAAINQCGTVKVNGKSFHPVLNSNLVEAEYTVDGAVKKYKIPDPFNVSLVNLRETVESLSDPLVPENIRAEFIKYNPLPGATFDDKNILANPDDIIPPGYDRDALEKDAYEYKYFLDNVKLRKSALVTKLNNCSSSGSITMLVTVSPRKGKELNDLDHVISSNIEVIQCDSDISLGVSFLMGERIPEFYRNLINSDVYVLRNPRFHVQTQENYRIMVRWVNHQVKKKAAKNNIISFAIPVTTRGIGFLVAEYWNRIERDVEQATQNMVYRISLAQLQLKMSNAKSKLLSPSGFNDQERNARIPYLIKQEVEEISINFSLISNAISQCGLVANNRKYFHPTFTEPPMGEYTVDGITKKYKIPDPFNVNFSNLRGMVESLSDPLVPENLRADFIKYNPLPGAIFDDNSILTNPDEIIPPVYGAEDLSKEILIFKELLAYASMKLQNVIGTIDYSLNGRLSLLATTLIPYHSNTSQWRLEVDRVTNKTVVSEPQNFYISNLDPVESRGEVIFGGLYLMGEWIPKQYMDLVNRDFYILRNPRYHYEFSEFYCHSGTIRQIINNCRY